MPHDVFICYATKDRRVADTPCAAIKARGFRCWMAPRALPTGDPLKYDRCAEAEELSITLSLIPRGFAQDIVRIAGTLRRDLSCVLPSRTCLIRNGLERKG